jgi:hypothetical protein
MTDDFYSKYPAVYRIAEAVVQARQLYEGGIRMATDGERWFRPKLIVYVGYNELFALRSLPFGHRYSLQGPATRDAQHMQFMGLPVIRVCADDYLHVAAEWGK